MITAIAGQGNTGIVAQLGGKTMALFISMIAASSLFAFLVAPPLVAMLSVDPEASLRLLESTATKNVGSSELPPFRDWLVALIPTNPIRAAADNAVLSLMIFTGLFFSGIIKDWKRAASSYRGLLRSHQRNNVCVNRLDNNARTHRHLCTGVSTRCDTRRFCD
jgi:Na+/H+-dicarboxylate symporter